MSLTQSFGFRKYRSRTTRRWRWLVYQHDSGGCRLIGREVEHDSKGAARTWAKGWAAFNRVEYREYVRPPEPPPPGPQQAAIASIDLRSRVAQDCYGKDWPRAAEAWIFSAKACLEAVAIIPGKRVKLTAGAKKRLEHAKYCLDEWAKAIDQLPVQLSLIKGTESARDKG